MLDANAIAIVKPILIGMFAQIVQSLKRIGMDEGDIGSLILELRGAESVVTHTSEMDTARWDKVAADAAAKHGE